MKAPAVKTLRRPVEHRRRVARRPQLQKVTLLVPGAVARNVVEEVSRWLGVVLPSRYAARLAFQAERCFAHSPSFREKIDRPGHRGRDLLYVFMRHWLAARLHEERPALFRRLPREFSAGAELPPRPARFFARPLDAWLARRSLTTDGLLRARHGRAKGALTLCRLAGGQENHRCRAAPLNFAAHVEAAHVGQADIEHDERHRLRGEDRERVAPRRFPERREALGLQCVDNRLGNGCLIFHHQD